MTKTNCFHEQPCTFIAASYVLLGRLVRYLRADKYLFIRATLVSIIFVMADVITFLIQVRRSRIVWRD